MAIPFTVSRKRLWLILEAIDARIAAEELRYTTQDSGLDGAGDFGNDLHNLKLQRAEFFELYESKKATAHLYECWFDPQDSGLCLLRFENVQRNRENGQLSERAVLQYSFIAHTGEEAMAVHHLRQGWAPYVPMGEAAPCPTCGANYYPNGYGDCWRCEHIG
jgi:hypothetical protein